MARTPSRRDRRRAGSTRQVRKILARAAGHLDRGDAAQAVPLIEEILAADPAHGGAHHLAGVVCYRNGQLDAALAHARRAVDGAPDAADHLDGLGAILRAHGRFEDAAAAFGRAAEADPASPQRHANHGFARREAGDLYGALEAFGEAVRRDPTHVNAYLGWADLLGRATTPSYDPEIAAALLRALTGPLSAPEELAPAIANQVKRKFDISESVDAPKLSALDPNEPLFAAYLRRCLNIDPVIERSLTGHRRRLAKAVTVGWSDNDQALAGLIARQGFINEYAFFAETGEIEALDAWDEALTDQPTLDGGDGTLGPEVTTRLLAFAMYRPLSAFDGAGRLMQFPDDALGPDLAELVSLSLRDRGAEEAIKAEIPTLSAIEDATSRKVQAQYEEHPYPRWTAPTPQAPMHPARELKRQFPHFEPPAFLDDQLSILIAGCGTGRHVASVRTAYPDARITAIDISRASIAYGMRNLSALGLARGISFMQADILEAGGLQSEFEMIQSVGVLHHMAEPLAGWRVLAGLLRPGGVMKIGLYSERGRREVLRCRQIIADEGIGSSDREMAAFRYRLMAGEAPGVFDKVMARADFYSLSMCRDLLFHVQEVCYTPLRIKTELEDLGLRFIGFEETGALGLDALYRERFPESPNLDDLDRWESLEASLDDPPEGYVFWCWKPA